MITISESAQQYFKHLISQQEQDGLGLRIGVSQPGTPNAACDLQFCPMGQQQEDDETLTFEGFNLYVAAGSVQWLETAEIDFEEDATGGQLSIKAPGIKGKEPEEGASLDERVQWLLDSRINPQLASHGGRAKLVEVTADKAVVLELGGGCQGCGMADVTLKQGIEQTFRQELPEITAVIDATDHQHGDNPYYAQGDSGSSAV